jgi:hypothetical protein
MRALIIIAFATAAFIAVDQPAPTAAAFTVPAGPQSFPEIEEVKRGCCSHHNGVCGCNASAGRQLCCDGSTSPSCGC